MVRNTVRRLCVGALLAATLPAAPSLSAQGAGKRTPEQIQASLDAHKGEFDYLLGDWEFTGTNQQYGRIRGYWSAVRLDKGQILDEYRVVGDKGETYYVTTTLRNYNGAHDRWELVGADAGAGLQDVGTGRWEGGEMRIEQTFGVAPEILRSGGSATPTSGPIDSPGLPIAPWMGARHGSRAFSSSRLVASALRDRWARSRGPHHGSDLVVGAGVALLHTAVGNKRRGDAKRDRLGAPLTARAQGTATPVDDSLLRELVALERSALDRWIRLDPQGYLDLYAAEVTYFDPTTERRVDGLKELQERLAPMRNVKLPFKNLRYEMVDPGVQRHGDVALLTFNVINYGTLPDRPESVVSRWNSTEVYRRIDGKWRIVHSHWSLTKPEVKQPGL